MPTTSPKTVGIVIIFDSLYVDDYLDSTDFVEGAIPSAQNIIRIVDIVSFNWSPQQKPKDCRPLAPFSSFYDHDWRIFKLHC